MTSRRGFLIGAAALLATPAVIRIPGLLMPIRKVMPRPQLTLAELMKLRREETMNAYSQAFSDEWLYGTGFIRITGDSAKRLDSREVLIKATPNGFNLARA